MPGRSRSDLKGILKNLLQRNSQERPWRPAIPLCHNFIYLFIYVFISGCAGSPLLFGFFSRCGERGPLSSCGAQSSHCSGFSCCRARALGMQASVAVTSGLQSLCSMVVAHRLCYSPVRGVFPNQTRTPVSRIGRGDSLPLSHQGRRPPLC